MGYCLKYHPEVKNTDLPKIPRNIQTRIKKAIEHRLIEKPMDLSVPLRKSLQGYRKLRVGDYRVIFRIDAATVVVLIVAHRKDVYRKIANR